MYRQFEELSISGEKVGETSKAYQTQLAAQQAEQEDTSCGYAEEGQDGNETKPPAGIVEEKKNELSTV